MTTHGTQFTVTTLVAAASEVLEIAGFRPVPPSATDNWGATIARVFEDPYSIVCVAVYETWDDLSSRWTKDQASLVTLISKHLLRTDAKAWDGYLALLTPSFVPADERPDFVKIQRNTLHLRKLLAGGDELKSVGGVRRTLLPLLPLEEYDALKPRNILDSLPPLLTHYGLDEEPVRIAIEAFQYQRTIIEQLHSFVIKKREDQP